MPAPTTTIRLPEELKARLARLALTRLSEGRRTERAGALAVMLELAAGAGLIDEEAVEGPVVKAELDLFRAVLDRRADHGLAANLQRLSWCATQAREHLSLDHWHALKRLSAEIEACRERASDVSALLEFLDEALTTFVSLSGFAMDTMTRDMGWRLHIIGRRLERLDNLAGTLARFLRRYTGLDSPLNRELVKRSNDKLKMNPNYSLAGSYICTKLLIDGIIKAGSVDQKAVIAALEGHKYQGLTGEEEVRKADHQVLKNYYLLKGKAKSKMKNKDDCVDVLSSGKSFLPFDQTGCKRA